MDVSFKGSIPGVRFSQFEYKGDVDGFIGFLKELEERLSDVPNIFSVNPQDKNDVNNRLVRQNKAIIEIQKAFPESAKILSSFKE